jgi:hypothetical protein
MAHNDLVQHVAAAATTQVKLCPYDEEEPHIWFRLIEAQFAAAGIKPQKLKCANTLANLPKQVHRNILDALDVCNEYFPSLLVQRPFWHTTATAIHYPANAGLIFLLRS